MADEVFLKAEPDNLSKVDVLLIPEFLSSSPLLTLSRYCAWSKSNDQHVHKYECIKLYHKGMKNRIVN